MKMKDCQPFWLTVFFNTDKIIYIAKVAFSAFGCKNYNTNSDEVFFQGCAWLMGSKVILKMKWTLLYLTLSEQEN